ncbi:hypothetical protein [Caldimonas brevitalea]|uniref:Uncharacterized protein n=1 Tax=Caldimonas brevitalea TaxID=413882 RepID=A0A0G3BJX8_9BURK|nr:hypothetical protein [Caldimonas brevitalea]AKJ29717.1 hypothetical protein AAW51_3026 [Caldimonas brevitalea]
MVNSAPRPLVALLALVIFSKVLLIALSNGPHFPAVLWPALFAALGLSALFGKQWAATALTYLLYAAGVLSLLLPLFAAQSALGLAARICWAGLAIATATYISKSPSVRGFYQSPKSELTKRDSTSSRQ